MQDDEFAKHAEIEDEHWWFRARREIMLEVLSRFVPANQNRSLLEIGCGTGGNLKFFSRYYTVMGADTSAEAVFRARERLSCEILLGEFTQILGGKWRDIDAVVLADVLEHVEEDGAFLGRLAAAMRPGSYLLITVPANRFLWSEHDVVLGHKRRYSSEGLHALWRGLDLDEMFFSPFNSIAFPFIALYRVLRRVLPPSGTTDLHLPPSWINSMLYSVFVIDRWLMRFTPLPWGTSYLVLLKRR